MYKTKVIHSTTNGHFKRIQFVTIIKNADWTFCVSCVQVPEWF